MTAVPVSTAVQTASEKIDQIGLHSCLISIASELTKYWLNTDGAVFRVPAASIYLTGSPI